MHKFMVHMDIYRAEKAIMPKNIFNPLATKGIHYKVSVEVDAECFDDATELAMAKVRNLFRCSDIYDVPQFFVLQIDLVWMGG